jgi:hypothetical protein
MEATENKSASMPPPLTPAVHPCSACKQPASQRCSACSNARYCSTECQKKDWKMHKMLCMSFATLEQRPGPNFFRGIFVPADEPLPRFVWIEYNDASESTSLLYTPFVGRDLVAHISHSGWRNLKRLSGHRMGIYYNDDYMNDNSPVTPSLTNWLGPNLGSRFRGPFLAHGYENGELYEDGEESDEVKPCDLDTSVLRLLLEFFYAQGTEYKERRGVNAGSYLPQVFPLFPGQT